MIVLGRRAPLVTGDDQSKLSGSVVPRYVEAALDEPHTYISVDADTTIMDDPARKLRSITVGFGAPLLDAWSDYLYGALYPAMVDQPVDTKYLSKQDDKWALVNYVCGPLATEVLMNCMQSLQHTRDYQIAVWVHDYHVAPVLMAARRLMASGSSLAGRVRFVYQHHVPWTDHPVLDRLALCIYEADLICFHTDRDLREYQRTIERLRPARLTPGEPMYRVNMIGLDHAELDALPPDTLTRANLEAFTGATTLIGSADNCEPAKDVTGKLIAFQAYLNLHPEDRSVALVQELSFNRQNPSSGRAYADAVINLAAEIVDQHGGDGYRPVYLTMNSPRRDVLNMLRSLDICWVSSLRDGANLVCREYAWMRREHLRGLGLILSDGVGAARMLQAGAELHWAGNYTGGPNCALAALERVLGHNMDKRHFNAAWFKSILEQDTVKAWRRRSTL